MQLSFEGKKILITGGTKGIGLAMARAFQESKGEVTVTGTSDFNDKYLKYQKVNFLEDSQLKEFLNFVKSESFDIVINNAGINKIDDFEAIQIQDYDDIQQINTRAPFLITQAALPSMKKNKFGRILFIGSVFGTVSKAKRTSYSTSKAALLGMTRALALETASQNIMVNCISPGFIKTALTEKILTPSQIEEMIKLVPAQRLGDPKDIAPLAIFLASEQNAFITGQNIFIDGGFTCA